MGYDVAGMRKKIQDSKNKFKPDPDELIIPKLKDLAKPETNPQFSYKFFICPPFKAGDQLLSGPAQSSMDFYYVPFAQHWFFRKPYTCPRVTHGGECPACQAGFDLMADIPKANRKARSDIAQIWLPKESYVVNIYFPHLPGVASDYAGRVLYYKAPKTAFDLWSECMSRDGSPDPDNPVPYGAFFDENAGFLFELLVTLNGEHNEYKKSHFINLIRGPQPMIKGQDGNIDQAATTAMMNSRHNLFTKLPPVDLPNLQNAVNTLMTGGQPTSAGGAGGFDQDDYKAPVVPTAPVVESRAPITVPVTTTVAPVAQPTHTTTVQPTVVAPAAATGSTSNDADIQNLLNQMADID